MTDDWKRVASTLIGSWPAKTWSAEAVAAYCAELQARGLTPAAAVEALRAAPGDFPPSVGAVAALAERQAQGPAPSFAQAQAEIARWLTMLPSAASRQSTRDAWPAFIARLGEHHEVTARFALALGPQGVRSMPDPRAAGLSQGDGVRISAHERDLKAIVSGWQEEPTRGVALTEAHRAAGLSSGDTEAIEQARRELPAGRS
jgi:hypothetical protein